MNEKFPQGSAEYLIDVIKNKKRLEASEREEFTIGFLEYLIALLESKNPIKAVAKQLASVEARIVEIEQAVNNFVASPADLGIYETRGMMLDYIKTTLVMEEIYRKKDERTLCADLLALLDNAEELPPIPRDTTQERQTRLRASKMARFRFTPPIQALHVATQDPNRMHAMFLYDAPYSESFIKNAKRMFELVVFCLYREALLLQVYNYSPEQELRMDDDWTLYLIPDGFK